MEQFWYAIGLLIAIGLIALAVGRREQRLKANQRKKDLEAGFIVRTYTGKQSQALERYNADALELAKDGFFPTSQTWAPGNGRVDNFWLPFCFVLSSLAFSS